MAVNIKILQAGDLDELIGLAAGRDESLSINEAQELEEAPRVVANNPLLYNFEGADITSGAELFVDVFRGWDVPSEPDEIHTFKAMRVSYDAYTSKGVFSIDLGRVAAALLLPVADGAQTLQTEPAERVFNRIGLGVRLLDNGATTFRFINSVVYTGVHQIGDPRGAGELQWRDGTPAPMVVIGGREFYYYIEGQGGGAANTYELRDADTGVVLTWVINADAEALNRSILNADDLRGARTVEAYKLLDEPVQLEHGSGSGWPEAQWQRFGGAVVSDRGVRLPATPTHAQLYTNLNRYAAASHRGEVVLVFDCEIEDGAVFTVYQGRSGGQPYTYREYTKSGRYTVVMNNINAQLMSLRNFGASGEVLVKSAAFHIIRPELLQNPNFRADTNSMIGSATPWGLKNENAESKTTILAAGGLAMYGRSCYAYQAQSVRGRAKFRHYVRENTTPTANSRNAVIRFEHNNQVLASYGISTERGWHEIEVEPLGSLAVLYYYTNGADKTKGLTIDAASLVALEPATVYDLDSPVLEDGSTTWPTAWTKYDDSAYRHVDKLTTGVKLTADVYNSLAAIYQQAADIQAGDSVAVALEWTGGDHPFAVDVMEYDGGTLKQTWTFNHGDTVRHEETFSFIASVDAPTIRVANNNAGDVLVHEVHARVTYAQEPELRQSGKYLTEIHCENDYFLKWLDRDGIYRFGTFNSYATASTKVGEAVKTDNYIEYLSGADARSTVHSRAIDPTLALHKRRVSSEIYNHYESLAGSPKVYLQNGDGVWREVVVEWNSSRVQDRNFHDIDIIIYLGSDYIQKV